MGLSSLPAPSEGVLCVILMNTALSISIVKSIIRTILHIVGIHLQPSSSSSSQSAQSSTEYLENSSASILLYQTHPDTYIEEFRSRTPTVRFDTICGCKKPYERECSVCLTNFEPESEINHLGCGHVFHKVCLDKWLDYWNITCPLCRTPLMPEEESEETSCT